MLPRHSVSFAEEHRASGSRRDWRDVCSLRNVLRANLTVCSYLHVERRSLVGRSFYEFLNAEDAEAVRVALGKALRGDFRTSFNVSFSHRAGAVSTAKLTLCAAGGEILIALQDLATTVDLDGKLKES